MKTVSISGHYKERPRGDAVRRSGHIVQSSHVLQTHRYPRGTQRPTGKPSGHHAVETPVKNGWWQSYTQVSPAPGSYDHHSPGHRYDTERKPHAGRIRIEPPPRGREAASLHGAHTHSYSGHGAMHSHSRRFQSMPLLPNKDHAAAHFGSHTRGPVMGKSTTPRHISSHTNRKYISRHHQDYEEGSLGDKGWWQTVSTVSPMPEPHGDLTLSHQYDTERQPNGHRLRIEPPPRGRGAASLHGVHSHGDSPYIPSLLAPVTQSYDTGERNKRSSFDYGKKDRDINVATSPYKAEKRVTVTIDIQPSKHGVLNTHVRSNPVIRLLPDEDHAPLQYESPTRDPVMGQSATPRFISPHTNEIRAPNPYDTSGPVIGKSTSPRFVSSHMKVAVPDSY